MSGVVRASRSLWIAAGLAAAAVFLSGCSGHRMMFGDTIEASEAGGEVVCPPGQQCPEQFSAVRRRYIGAYVSPDLVSGHNQPGGPRRPNQPERFNGPPAGSLGEQIVCPGDRRCPEGPNGWVYSGRLWLTTRDQVFCEPGEHCDAYPAGGPESPGYGWFCLRNRQGPDRVPCPAAVGPRRP